VTWPRLPALAVDRLRESLWTLKGCRLGNPPLPASIRSLLFVCKGNICRSPFAGWLAARLAPEYGLAACRFESAGIVPSRDGRCPPEAIAAALPYGVDLHGHTPAVLSGHLGQQFDLIVAMDAQQFAELRRRWPHWRRKIVLLSLLDPEPGGARHRYNIVDPYGRPSEVFTACYARVERSLRTLLRAVADTSARSGALPECTGDARRA
jgi:protein-tyrosine-phosphatase